MESNKEEQNTYGIFWNDELTDEKEYISKIKEYCSRYKELSESETRELLVFFGRCFSSIAWHKVADIFSIEVIKHFMQNENEQMRKTVIPAMRTEYDKSRAILLHGIESLDIKPMTPEEWESRPRKLSKWRKLVFGSYDADYMRD